MKKILLSLIFILSSSFIFAQSYHTINIDGINDFNSAKEKLTTTSGTASYAYVTWDAKYLYVGFSGNTPAGSLTDNNRIIHIYIDTDPKQNPTDGTGSTTGEAWRWTPTLPFTANYHYAFKTADNSVYTSVYNTSWDTTTIHTSNWKGAGFWEVRLLLSDLGSPKQINLVAYIEEDWTGGSISSGIPNDLFVNTSTQGNITFNNHWLNYILIDQISPNASYNEDNYQWLIRLKAITGSLKDTSAYAGMGTNYNDGFDSTTSDIPKPPTPPSNYIELYFPHPGWNSNLGPYFKRDFKKIIPLDSSSSTWAFTVNTDQINSNVHLQFDSYNDIPSGYNINIRDLSLDSLFNVKSGSDYIFNTGSSAGNRLFNLIIGKVLSSPQISISPSSLDFGSVKIGRDSTLSLKAKNLGDSTLNITNIVSSDSAFTFTGGTTYTITGKDSITIPVTFSPAAVQAYSANLTITSNDLTNSPSVVQLTGTGLNLFPRIVTSDSSINYDSVKIDLDSTVSFKIYNRGDTTLNISNIVVSNSVFSNLSGTSFTVLKNDSVTISVKFHPLAAVSYSGDLSIISDDPTTDTLIVTLAGTGISSNFSKTFFPGWNLFSIPAIASDSSATSIINLSSFYLFGYANSGGYLPESYLNAGKGYWLGIEDTLNLSFTGSAVTDTFKLSLKSGWNLSASPYIRAYPKNAILISRNDTTVSSDSAASLGWIQNNFYTYNSTSGSYSSEDTLAQWKGYWFATLTDSLNIIYLHSSTINNPLLKRNNNIKKSVPSLNNWIVRITAKNNTSIDDMLIFGANNNATDNFDARYDYAKPPIAPANNAIQSYFGHNNWSPLFSRYSTDIKKKFIYPESGKSWTFNVLSKLGGKIILSWQNILSEIPKQIKDHYNFVLSGQVLNNNINMLSDFSVSFDGQKDRIYTFFINSLVTSVNESNIIPLTFKLSQNYPNPFNPTTVIKYSIPVETKHALSVQLKIYDILGREVAVLVNEQQKPGYYKVNFDASRLSSGIYFYRLSAIGGGKNFEETKKMILLK